MKPSLREADLEAGIGFPPDPRNPRHPVLAPDGFPSLSKFWRRKNARSGRELRPDHFTPHRARRYRDSRAVANPFGFTHVAARRDVEFAVLLPKPNWRWNPNAIPSKCLQRNIFLIGNRGRNLAGHGSIVVAMRELSASGNQSCYLWFQRRRI